MNEEMKKVFRACRFSLTGHPKSSPREVLLALAERMDPDTGADFYSQGALIENFEKKVARELGHPAAVFLPSGTLAQTIALRIWSDEAKSSNDQNVNVAFHPPVSSRAA